MSETKTSLIARFRASAHAQLTASAPHTLPNVDLEDDDCERSAIVLDFAPPKANAGSRRDHSQHRDGHHGNARPGSSNRAEHARPRAGHPRSDKSKKKPNLAEQVMSVIQAGAEIFRDQRGLPYAAVPTPPGRQAILPLTGAHMRLWAARACHAALGRTVGRAAIDEAVQTLAGYALYDANEHPVYLRVAQHEGRIYVDLGDDTGQCVEVCVDGWEIIERPPVRFLRSGAMRALPRPARGGCMDDLSALVNAPRQVLLLFVGWLLGALRPEHPFPILEVGGEPGSSKSTISRLAKTLIDPNKVPLRSPPVSEGDLVVAAQHSHLLAFDNISRMHPWLADALCRLATGGGIAKRALYTDHDEIAMDALRPIVMNGIDPLLNRGDLAERAVALELKRIPPHRRKTEAELDIAIAAAAPRILGWLFDGVAAGLACVGSVHLDVLPRMADYAQWLAATAAGMGLAPDALLSAYLANCSTTEQMALESSVLGDALHAFAMSEGPWEGTATQLLDALAQRYPDLTHHEDWPSGPSQLTGAIRRVAQSLRTLGVNAKHTTVGRDKNKRRVWQVSAVPADRDDRDGTTDPGGPDGPGSP